MSKSIYEFKKGDYIVRVEPTTPIGESMFGEPGVRDRSYLGQKQEFLGILNGCIYVRPCGTSWFDKKDNMRNLPLDVFSDGWDAWVDPKILLEPTNNTRMNIPTSELKKRIELALENEDYELADKLNKKLKK